MAPGDSALRALPLLRIAEAFDSAAEVAQLCTVCRDFLSHLWEVSGRRLLTPRLALQAHTNANCLQRIRPGALRVVSIQDAAFVAAPGSCFIGVLLSEAVSLERLKVSLLQSWLQDRWQATLEALAEGLRRAEVRGSTLTALLLEGRQFPEAGAALLAAILAACTGSLREFQVDFQSTTGTEPLEDSALWTALAGAQKLQVLRLAGLRTSAGSCQGLTKVLSVHASSLRVLGLGAHTATSLLLPPSALDLEATLPRARVSTELLELLSAGVQLRLQSLALTDLLPPSILGPLAVGFGRAAANLGALLEACSLLAPWLRTLDLSNNGQVASAALPPTGPYLDGGSALLKVFEACGPLEALNLSGSGLCLWAAAPALLMHGSTLLQLRLSGAALTPLGTGLRAEHAVRTLGDALGACDQLQVLDLGKLGLISALRRPILRLLQRSAPSLRVLVAALPASLVEAGLSSLFATGTCLEGGARRLEEVDLAVVASGFQGVQILKANARSLRRLRLRAALGDAAGADLCRALRDAPLEALCLASCNVGPNTCRYLAGALTSRGLGATSRLTDLSLSFNNLGDEAVTLLGALRSATSRHGRLQRLRLQRCGLTASSCKQLGRLAVRLPSLELLDVRGNNFKEAGGNSFLLALLHEWSKGGSKSAAIAVLDFRGCGCSEGPAEGPAEGQEQSAPAGRLPRRLGRLRLLWQESDASDLMTSWD